MNNEKLVELANVINNKDALIQLGRSIESAMLVAGESLSIDVILGCLLGCAVGAFQTAGVPQARVQEQFSQIWEHIERSQSLTVDEAFDAGVAEVKRQLGVSAKG